MYDYVTLDASRQLGVVVPLFFLLHRKPVIIFSGTTLLRRRISYKVWLQKCGCYVLPTEKDEQQSELHSDPTAEPITFGLLSGVHSL